MEARQIIQADYLDMLFAGRNKNYGAYKLRKTYYKRLWTALAVTLLISFSGFWLLQSGTVKEVVPFLEKKEIFLSAIEELKTPPPVQEEKIVQAPAKATTQVTTKARVVSADVKRTKFTTPIVKDKVSSEAVPTVDEIAIVDNITVDGAIVNQVMAPVPPPVVISGTAEGEGTAAIPVKPKEEEQNRIFEKVEIEASVNVARWRQHLERNLVRYIEDAATAGMQPGTYTVMVRFLVEKDGSISRVLALNDPGFGLARGAAQVVESGPQWNPGEQNGRKVRSYHTQPITFVIMES
ncbi:MAG: hypothetical protein EON98_12995 [Chitinophagaceae bacterium]|nr:MAG: hypothetical protein EON98_12995 [Chitinophagaceae bacterium]